MVINKFKIDFMILHNIMLCHCINVITGVAVLQEINHV